MALRRDGSVVATQDLTDHFTVPAEQDYLARERGQAIQLVFEDKTINKEPLDSGPFAPQKLHVRMNAGVSELDTIKGDV